MVLKFNQSTWTKLTKVALVAVLCLVVLAACGQEEEVSLSFGNIESETKVATYSQGEVTDKEFEKFKSTLAVSQGIDKAIFDMEGYREYVLEQYVIYKYIASQASEEVKAAALEEVETQLTSYKNYLSQVGVDYEQMIKDYGISEADLKTFFYLGSTVSGHLDSLITNEDLTELYNREDSTYFADFSTYDVRHILSSLEVKNEAGEVTTTRTEEEALARANEAKAKLDAGESWDTVAKTYSDDLGSKDNGGLYSNTKGMSWEENFKKAAFEQEVGVIGEPVKSTFGYHVMLVEKRETPTFDQLSEAEVSQLRFDSSNIKFGEIYDTQVEALNIQLNLPEVEPETEEGTPESTDGANAPAEESTDTQTEEKTTP